MYTIGKKGGFIIDIQIKRGVLELLVLSLLRDHDYYGYSLMNDVQEYLEVSDFALYPILKRLESDAQVTTYSVEVQGRLRKYYQITKKGKETLTNSKNDWLILKKIYAHILGGGENE